MRFAAPAIAIASLAALVAGETDKILQIGDGQLQGPGLSACAPYLAVTSAPCPAAVSPTPCPVAVSPTYYPAAASPTPSKVHRPAPSPTGAPCPPMIFKGGALARDYPIGGAMALCAIAIALAMI